MKLELDDEELPALSEQAPLWIAEAPLVATTDLKGDFVPLVEMPVGPHQEGDWADDWAPTAQAMAGRRVAIALSHQAGRSPADRSRLMRRSVQQLLELAAPQFDQVAAAVLERVAAHEVLASDGRWEEELVGCWAEWASVLPDAVTPVVAVDLAALTDAEALQLAVSSQPRGVTLALRLPSAMQPLRGEVPWMGWGAPTPRGAILSGAEAENLSQGPDEQQAVEAYTVGVVMPMDHLRSVADCQELLRVWRACMDRRWRVRLLKEEEIHQSWHGLEALVVLGDRISGKGRRQLAGFLAAGGSILWHRQETGMVEEQPFLSSQEYPVVD